MGARPATTYAAPITTSAPIRSAPISYGTTVGAPMSYPSTLTSSVGLGAYGGVVVATAVFAATVPRSRTELPTRRLRTEPRPTVPRPTVGRRLPTPDRRRRRLDRHLKLRRRAIRT